MGCVVFAPGVNAFDTRAADVNAPAVLTAAPDNPVDADAVPPNAPWANVDKILAMSLGALHF